MIDNLVKELQALQGALKKKGKPVEVQDVKKLALTS
jgi:hypothetical protein